MCIRDRPNSLFGETAMKIVGEQFQKLRDGDRFYYENESAFTFEEIAAIKQTRLADVIRRNFDVTIQDEVFFVEPPQELSTSIEEVISTQTLSIAPNPAINYTTIAFEALENGPASYLIINGLGQTIQQQAINVVNGSNTFSINLPASISSGFYTIRLEMNGSALLSKLMVKK